MRTAQIIWLAMTTMSGACGDRSLKSDTSATGQPQTSEDPSETGESEGDSATGPLEPCPEGLVRCSNGCSTLSEDPWNCGECDRACPLADLSAGIGGCDWQGECVPAWGPCVGPDDDVPHCEALCNSVGQHCAAERHTMWFSPSEDANCAQQTTAMTHYDAPCDAPFEWRKMASSSEPAIGATCMCTNDF